MQTDLTGAADQHRQAAETFGRHLYGEAAAAARRGLEQSPDDGRLWELLGAAQWAQQDPEALRSLETATCLVPLSPSGELALASAYARAGKPDLARVLLENLCRLGRCPARLLPRLAATLGAVGDYGRALRACEELLEYRPDHHGALFGVAYYGARLGHPPAEVIWPLTRALDLAPHVLSYRINLACLWAGLGRLGKAYDLLRPVPVDQVSRPCWLRKMLAVFGHWDDLDRCLACLSRMEELGLSPRHEGHAQTN